MSDIRPERIEQLGRAVYPSFALLAGMQLDLFTALAAGPQTASQVAAATAADAGKVRTLLYALVGAGLLTVAAERFANTPEAARYLVRGRDGCLLERRNLWSELWAASLQTAASIRSGVPQARKDFAAMSPPELGAFLSGLHPSAVADGRRFAARIDMTGRTNLVDVAGGSGGFALGLTERLPPLRATVVDLPQVIAHTRRFIQESGAGGRVRAEAGDVVDGELAGDFDVAMLRNFVQILAPDQIRRVLAGVGAALQPGGALYICGDILDDSRLSPADTVAFNLVFANIYEAGQAYTEEEHRAWLSEAGFEEIERVDTDIMRARKPASS